MSFDPEHPDPAHECTEEETVDPADVNLDHLLDEVEPDPYAPAVVELDAL